MRGSGENWNAESGLANMQIAKNIAVFVERQQPTSKLALNRTFVIDRGECASQLAVDAGASLHAILRARRKALQNRSQVMAFALSLIEHEPPLEIVEMLAHLSDRTCLVPASHRFDDLTMMIGAALIAALPSV